MQLSDFDYELPEGFIAPTPAESRDASRLMVVPRRAGEFEHRAFPDFPGMLSAGDVLVLNDTRVIPARLRGHKQTGGKTEILLDRPLESPWMDEGLHCQRWACLVNASRPLKEGVRVDFPGDGQAICQGDKRVLLRLPLPVEDYLQEHGEVPLPAYIRRVPRPADRERYQTVYARNPGAIAAPTAGFHFTGPVLDGISRSGVEVVKVTLHVGPGTFLPVRTQDVDRHVMHKERYRVSGEAARAVTRAREQGRRVVAVGTTVVRTLESAWDGKQLVEGEGETGLFIRPGYGFSAVDVLLTNFHLPRSTLLMLVCAFADTDRILSAYKEAVDKKYRFYSYGDAMFLH
jgi:S-adenosylmethionine:tRNA ribosyltransferase-isomerase